MASFLITSSRPTLHEVAVAFGISYREALAAAKARSIPIRENRILRMYTSVIRSDTRAAA